MTDRWPSSPLQSTQTSNSLLLYLCCVNTSSSTQIHNSIIHSCTHVLYKMGVLILLLYSLSLSLSLSPCVANQYQYQWTAAMRSRTPFLSTRLQRRCQRPLTSLPHLILIDASLSRCLRRLLVYCSSQLSALARGVCVSRVMQDVNKLLLSTWYDTRTLTLSLSLSLSLSVSHWVLRCVCSSHCP